MSSATARVCSGGCGVQSASGAVLSNVYGNVWACVECRATNEQLQTITMTVALKRFMLKRHHLVGSDARVSVMAHPHHPSRGVMRLYVVADVHAIADRVHAAQGGVDAARAAKQTRAQRIDEARQAKQCQREARLRAALAAQRLPEDACGVREFDAYVRTGRPPMRDVIDLVRARVRRGDAREARKRAAAASGLADVVDASMFAFDYDTDDGAAETAGERYVARLTRQREIEQMALAAGAPLDAHNRHACRAYVVDGIGDAHAAVEAMRVAHWYALNPCASLADEISQGWDAERRSLRENEGWLPRDEYEDWCESAERSIRAEAERCVRLQWIHKYEPEQQQPQPQPQPGDRYVNTIAWLSTLQAPLRPPEPIVAAMTKDVFKERRQSRKRKRNASARRRERITMPT